MVPADVTQYMACLTRTKHTPQVQTLARGTDCFMA